MYIMYVYSALNESNKNELRRVIRFSYINIESNLFEKKTYLGLGESVSVVLLCIEYSWW